MIKKTRGFGMIEVLMSLVLVGLVLGLVAKGYQTVNRLNQASYRLSQKLEAATFLRRLTAELSAASTLTPITNGVRIEKIDPKYNVEHVEPFLRLPWPHTSDPVDLNAGRITIEFGLNTAQAEISRTVASVSSVVLENVSSFTVTRNARIADVALVPMDSGTGWSTRVHIPGVAP